MSRLNDISLRNVVPDVFRDSKLHSRIWSCDITFKRGGNYLIQAESGTGKSSLCSFIYGNRHDYAGHILFDGKDIRKFGIDRWCQIRTNSLALLPQEMRLFPELTAYENIAIKNRLTGFKTDDEISAMLDLLEIADKADIPARFLSIGQQQRVAVVRTLCQPMDFLLLDEPVSHLDRRNNRIVAELIQNETSKQGAAIIATSVGYDIMLDFNCQLTL